MDGKPHLAEPAWPIVGVKDHKAPSVFRPESLLREARRQRQLPLVAVPEICVLDPDGDVVRHLNRTGGGRSHEGWACYHTELLAFDLDGIGEVGIVGCAVGAPFAVLVAEQLFASGCRFLISVTSSIGLPAALLAAEDSFRLEEATIAQIQEAVVAGALSSESSSNSILRGLPLTIGLVLGSTRSST